MSEPVGASAVGPGSGGVRRGSAIVSDAEADTTERERRDMATTRRVHPARRRTRVALTILTAGLAGAGLWWLWHWLVPGPVALGVAAYDQGRWREALAFAQQRLAAAKDDPRALRLLARATVRLGGLPQAQAIYDRLGPSDLEAEDYCVMGLASNLAGEPLAAREVLLRGLRLDPDHAESLHLLALAAFQRSVTVEATQAAERLAHRPGWEARADILLGMIRAGDNDPAGAVRAIEQALTRDPSIRLTPRTDSARDGCWHAACFRRGGPPRRARSSGPPWTPAATARPSGSRVEHTSRRATPPRPPRRRPGPARTAPSTRWSPNPRPMSVRHVAPAATRTSPARSSPAATRGRAATAATSPPAPAAGSRP